MTLFYAPDIAVDLLLPAEEAVHAVNVLRLTEGSEITLTDGKGFFYRATIRRAHPRHCEVAVLERRQPLPLWPYRIHIAVAPAKSADRTEWFLEKATETGIHAVTLLKCHRSERREMKTARLEKVMISAMKQSQQAALPKLTGMTPFRTFIDQPFDGCKFIAHCAENGTSLPLLKHVYRAGEHALILIGPEGGFTPEEIGVAAVFGFTPVSLGPSRLRTETAALAACHAIHILNDY
ncbi:MAG: 16S rRNA (uracil(1498)-N(3))-methyltransferase [Tannerella sp.]|jgi:16S rRNA (uracil1498-N3)-methyltransferase|nr:16S rRNA (uracil(1498)-N(3))-methyltransferase [Tannerella sp.]